MREDRKNSELGFLNDVEENWRAQRYDDASRLMMF